MDADWSVELGHDDPALEFPWSSPDGSHRYVDLTHRPEALSEIPEATQYSQLSEFLLAMNAPSSPWQTVKCDVWAEKEDAPESVLKGHSLSCAENALYPCHSEWASAHEGSAFPRSVALSEAEPLQSADSGVKFCSYVDLVFRDDDPRFCFARHEQWVKLAARNLSTDDQQPIACEFIVRRCWYRTELDPDCSQATAMSAVEDPTPGFYVTFYLFGYGNDEAEARTRWVEGLRQVTCLLTGLAP